jgi:hypothetical protein
MTGRLSRPPTSAPHSWQEKIWGVLIKYLLDSLLCLPAHLSPELGTLSSDPILPAAHSLDSASPAMPLYFYQITQSPRFSRVLLGFPGRYFYL